MGAWMNKAAAASTCSTSPTAAARRVSTTWSAATSTCSTAASRLVKAAIDCGSVKALAVTGDTRSSGAAERADLQGGRRAGVRPGELDRDAGAEGHTDGYPRRCCGRRRSPRSTTRRPARRWPSRASSPAPTRTCGHSSRRKPARSAARCASSPCRWGNKMVRLRFILVRAAADRRGPARRRSRGPTGRSR